MAGKRRWGEGTIRRLPSGSWNVRLPGSRQSKSFPSEALAEAWRKIQIGEMARGRAGLAPDPKFYPPLDRLAEDWIERIKITIRSWSNYRGSWENHLSPFFGRMRPSQVDVASIRAFVERRLRTGANKDTVRLDVACLSTLFSDLIERPRETGVDRNPCLGLPPSLRRMYRSEYDPRFTPYVKLLGDVLRLYRAMPEPVAVAYAIGVTAMLRPGEILALDFDEHIHIEDRRIDVRVAVRNGRLGPLKDKEARILQGAYLEPLWPVLAAWKLRCGGRGLVLPPELFKTPGRRIGRFTHPKRLAEGIAAAAKQCDLPDVATWAKPWYQATRHTGATHWLRAGHGLGDLARALGHSATFVTERYAHIQASSETADPWRMDYLRAPATVVEIGAHAGNAARHGKRSRQRG